MGNTPNDARIAEVYANKQLGSVPLLCNDYQSTVSRHPIFRPLSASNHTSTSSFLGNNFNPCRTGRETIHFGTLSHIAVEQQNGLCWVPISGGLGHYLLYEDYTIYVKVWRFSVLAWTERNSTPLTRPNALARMARGLDPLVGDIGF